MLCIGLFCFGLLSVALQCVIVVLWFVVACVLAVCWACLVVHGLCIDCGSVVSRLCLSYFLIVCWLHLGRVLDVDVSWSCLGCVLAMV
mgnify:CR=1 FL=1